MPDWDDDFDKDYICPICGSKKVVPASGDENSPYLIIGSFPGEEEVKDHQPMTGRTGSVLKAELRYLNRDFYSFRVTNVWHHPPNVNKKDPNYNACFEHGATLAIKEAINRKAILLIGSVAVKYFCSVSVESYNGLQVTSSYLSCPNIFAMIQPTTVFKGGLGEVRLALSKFVKRLERIENENKSDIL